MKRATTQNDGRHIKTNLTAIALAALLSLGVVPRPLGGVVYQYEAVRSLGDPAPGGGAFVNNFEPTRLNNRGVVAFTAEQKTIQEAG